MHILFTSSLYAQKQDNETFINTTNSYIAPDKYIFINKNIPSDTIARGINTGWSKISNLSDEFNSLNLTKWYLDFKFMNNGSTCLAYHKTDLSNHKLLTEGSNNFLRLETKKEYFEGRYLGALPEYIMDDSLPNFRPFYMTSAMIKNKDEAITPYGYFEMNCRIPASRFIIVDFWLWGVTIANGDTTVNDMNFEINDARNCYLSTNLKLPDSLNTRHYSNVITVDENLKNKFNTLAFKWEPQRVTFYINNEIVKTVTQNIPNGTVQMMINLGQEIFDSFFCSPDSFPCYYDINYIRTYKRDSNNPNYMDFSINGDSLINGYVVENGPNDTLRPIVVNTNSPIIINGNLPVCYNANTNANGIYFLSVQQCSDKGEPISGSTEYQKWLTNEESKNIEKYDVKKFCDQMNCTLVNGNYYRIKLATAGVG